MSKKAVVKAVQAKRGCTQKEAKSIVSDVIDAIKQGLQTDGKVDFSRGDLNGGFGVFTVTERAARQGRNPQTGEALQIASSKSVKFKPSGNFKSTL